MTPPARPRERLQIVSASKSGVFGPKHFSARVRHRPRQRWRISARTILRALAVTEGNVSRAADMLRINRTALFRLIRKYGISVGS